MSQASELLKAGQRSHAEQFPATITIAGQEYSVARSALQRDRDLISGGWLDKYRIAFWMPVSAFAAASKSVAAARDFVTWNGVAYVIAEAPLDATGSTITLRCESPDQ